MTKHVAEQRKDSAQRKIEKKIEVLEGYAADPKFVAKAVYVPKDLAAFRLWEDEDLGLEKIGSPNTMDKPHNQGLKKRALELIELLAKKKARKERRGKTIDTLRARNKKSDRLLRELTNQLHATRHELARSQQSERRLQDRVASLTEENGELRQKVKTIVGLDREAPARGVSHDVQ